MFTQYPSGIDVDQRVVGDVERVREVSEEPRHPNGGALYALLSGAKADDKWKDQDHTERLIQAIDPKLLSVAESRQRKRHHQQQAASRECVTDLEACTSPTE